MYDGAALSKLLDLAGFKSTVVLVAGDTTIINPACLDLKERDTESVYVEAVNS